MPVNLSTRTYQIFKPPYFYNSAIARPTISNAPAVVYYNQGFNVSTPDAANVTAVRLIRPGSATHSFDQDQRLIELSFTVKDATTIRVAAPAHGNIAPPGYYMLFVAVGPNGSVPSEGRFLRLSYYQQAPPPQQP